MPKRVEISPLDRAHEGILNYIIAHGLSKGDRLPSERELCVALDVSRTTLRSALVALSDQHVVECRPGAGTFVGSPYPTIRLDDLSGFSEIVAKVGKTPTSRVVWSGIANCPRDVAERLLLTPGNPIFKLRRVRFADQETVCVETAYVSAAACPGIEDLDFSRESLTATLAERYNMDTSHTQLAVTVVRASRDEAELLGVSDDDMVFRECGVRLNEQTQPVEYYETVYVPNRFGIVCDTVYKCAARSASPAPGGVCSAWLKATVPPLGSTRAPRLRYSRCT